jgi:hypothetical protein
MAKRERPVSASSPNEVQKLIAFREYLKRNKRFEHFEGEFRVSPLTINGVSLKPTQVNPRTLGSIVYKPIVYRDPIEEAFSSEYIRKAIRKERLTPTEKFRGPQTSSQEVGWYSFAYKRPSSAHSTSNKVMCNETVFAEEYLRTVGRSPFKVKARNQL